MRIFTMRRFLNGDDTPILVLLLIVLLVLVLVVILVLLSMVSVAVLVVLSFFWVLFLIPSLREIFLSLYSVQVIPQTLPCFERRLPSSCAGFHSQCAGSKSAWVSQSEVGCGGNSGRMIDPFPLIAPRRPLLPEATSSRPGLAPHDFVFELAVPVVDGQSACLPQLDYPGADLLVPFGTLLALLCPPDFVNPFGGSRERDVAFAR